MNDILEIGNFVEGNIWHVLPAFLLSVFIGILIRELKLDTVIKRAFQANVGLSIILATAIGAFSPFCSCTVIPVVAGLLISGVPLAPIMSFWIASPTMDPEIFSLSVATIGWKLAVARLAATLALSLGAGYLTWFLMSAGFLGGRILRAAGPSNASSCCDTPVPVSSSCCESETGIVSESKVSENKEQSCCGTPAFSQPLTTLTRTKLAVHPNLATASAGNPGISIAGSVLPVLTRQKPIETTSCCDSTPAQINYEANVVQVSSTAKEKWFSKPLENFRNMDWLSVAKQLGEQSLSLGKWLVLAFVMEALITLYVPQQAIADILGADNIFSIPLAALIGIPLYLSNVGSLPIVGGLLAKGMAPGAAIAFLIAGPGTTVPAMTAVWGVVEKKVFALYIAIIMGGAIILGFLTNLIIG